MVTLRAAGYSSMIRCENAKRRVAGEKHCRISSEPKFQLVLAGGNALLPVFLKVVDAIGCGIL